MIKSNRKRKEILAIVILAFGWNYAVYGGARLIAQSWYHTDITSPVDARIPLVPWTVILYIGWYVFWAVNYWICAAQKDHEDDRNRFFCADFLAKAVCFVIFLAFPTTNVRPAVVDTGFFGQLMRLVYYLDAPDNLFPSIHCIVSWLCWVGVRNKKEVSLGYRLFSLLVAIAICISTVTTKQHVLIDVIVGILLAELSYWVAGNRRIHNFYGNAVDRLFQWLRIT